MSKLAQSNQQIHPQTLSQAELPDSVQFLRLHAAGIIKHPVFSGNTAVKNQHIIRIDCYRYSIVIEQPYGICFIISGSSQYYIARWAQV